MLLGPVVAVTLFVPFMAAWQEPRVLVVYGLVACMVIGALVIWQQERLGPPRLRGNVPNMPKPPPPPNREAPGLSDCDNTPKEE